MTVQGSGWPAGQYKRWAGGTARRVGDMNGSVMLVKQSYRNCVSTLCPSVGYLPKPENILKTKDPKG